MERFGETRKSKEQDESDTGNRNKLDAVIHECSFSSRKA